MMARSGLRSSALARAEAQLAGQRVPVKSKDSKDELQEYMRALSNKTSVLKLSQPLNANLSDLSASEQESEKYKGTVSPQQSMGTQSRFLKKKTPASKDTLSNVKPASVVAKPQCHRRPAVPFPAAGGVPVRSRACTRGPAFRDAFKDFLGQGSGAVCSTACGEPDLCCSCDSCLPGLPITLPDCRLHRPLLAPRPCTRLTLGTSLPAR